jgi:4-hydroxy-2-oxoglutarate aldolase
MSLRLDGVFAAVATTFRRDNGDLDLAAFTENVRAYMTAGQLGVVVCGSTGEAALLAEMERSELLEAARRAVPPDRMVLMGVGAESTRLTVRRCHEAQTVGADAALVVAPHYYSNAMNFDALRAHYQRVADESPIPVLLYNIPKYMHFKLLPELVAEMARHGNVAGIKDSSGDLDLLASYIENSSETFSVMTGNGGQLHPALMAGARGGILALATFAHEQVVAIHRAHRSGDHATADRIQAVVKPVNAAIVGELGVPGVKAAMDAVGLKGGPVRGPLLDLDAAARARVASLVGGLSAVAA